MTVACTTRVRAADLRRLLVDAGEVCRRLGIAEGARPQSDGVLVRCPWHRDRTPSCSIRLGSDRTLAVKCHGCDRTGDVFHLVAAVNGLDVRRDFPAVVRLAAELAGQPVDGPARSLAAPPPESRMPDRTYPPPDDIATLWAAAGSVVRDAEAAEYLRHRGLGPAEVEELELARVIPRVAATPRWAAFGGRPWPRTGHRLLVPAFDADGRMRSLRAWRIIDGDTPKRLPPAGYRLAGLVLADATALTMLRRERPAHEIVVVEGEPNLLTWATWLHRQDPAREVAVFGLFSGGWTAEVAERIPDGAVVNIRTDHDEAGEKYAAVINQTLGHRCEVRRLSMPGGR
jgi:hypothetical protein